MIASEYSYERLDYLRRNTKLNIKDYLKILKLRLEAEKRQKINNQVYANYQEANLLEFLLRMKIWEKSYNKIWQINKPKMSLEQYSLLALNNLINEENILTRRYM